MTAQRLASRIHTVGLLRAVLAVVLILTAIRATLEFTPFAGFLAGIYGLSSTLLLVWSTVDATKAERVYRVAVQGDL